MKFVAIEYPIKSTGHNMLGYLRVPDDFNPSWHLGFREYLKQEKGVTGDIKIYPLNVQMNENTFGKNPVGYTDLENDFSTALGSLKYYPKSEENDNIRRQYAMLDPMSNKFVPKDRSRY